MKLVKNFGYYLDSITLQELIDLCKEKGETDPRNMIFMVCPECEHDENPDYKLYITTKEEDPGTSS